jgi:hypothetical protein
MLDPVPTDIAQSSCKHDLRLVGQQGLSGTSPVRNNRSIHPGFHPSPQESVNRDIDLVVATVKASNGHRVDVAIAYTNADSPGWTWDVNCLLVILETNADSGLTLKDVIDLNNEGVLVTDDEGSGKTILRVRILQTILSGNGDGNTDKVHNLYTTHSIIHTDNNINNNNNKTRLDSEVINSTDSCTNELNGLYDAIKRGISKAEKLELIGLAVVTPVGLLSIPSLNDNYIRLGTVESIINCIYEKQLHYIQRIVCLEVLRSDVTAELALVTNPYCDSYLVQSLLLLLLQSYNNNKKEILNKNTLSLVMTSVPFVTVIKYNLYDLINNDIYDTDSDEKVIVLRGLESGLLSAVHDIKQILLLSIK